MATQAMCSSYKAELMRGLHDHTQGTGHVFKCALYTSASPMGRATTAYTTLNEIVNTSGSAYSPGGFSWAAADNITPIAGVDGSYTSWSVNPSWTAASFTANSCLIYNSNGGFNRAVCVLTFGGNQTVTAGTFTIQLPTNGEATSILRIGA